VTEEEVDKRNEFLFAECKKLGARLKLPEDFLVKIFTAPDDWTFCILLSSVIEAMLNEFLARGLKFQIAGKITEASFSGPVEKLSMLGRTGRLTFAREAGLPTSFADYVEGVCLVRNSYAHSFANISKSLPEIVKSHPENRRLMKFLSVAKDDADGTVFSAWIEKDPSLLRYALYDSMMKLSAVINAAA
jgi:hypothetical protein